MLIFELYYYIKDRFHKKNLISIHHSTKIIILYCKTTKQYYQVLTPAKVFLDL